MKSQSILSAALSRIILFFAAIVILGATALTSFAEPTGQTQPAAFRDKLFDLVFTSPTDVVAVGYPGLILRSSDAGKTWNRIKISDNEPIFAVDFVGSKKGWIVGRSGLIYATSDAGATWSRQESGVTEPLFDVDFIDEQTGMAVGNFGTILLTTDGGATWTPTINQMMQSAAINGVLMLSPLDAIFVGEYPAWETELTDEITVEDISNIWRTNDGGKSWSRITTSFPKTLYDILFIDENVGFAAGSSGTLIKTYDAGETWKLLDTPYENVLVNMVRQGESVLVAGTEGVLLRVDNEKVTKLDTKLYTWLCGIAFGDKQHGVLVGGRGTVMYTDDGGATWTKHPIK